MSKQNLFSSGKSHTYEDIGYKKESGLKTIAELIKSGKAKNIVFMAGAGISTAAGIPDFRSPGTGLYDNLSKYNLPRPESIFEIQYFKKNPEPFFELARELYPSKFLPTLTHYFIKLLHDKEVLLRCFTQNIDTLEQIAGLPEEVVVEAHGSFSKSQCLKCKKIADPKWMKETIFSGVIPKCVGCNKGIVKPCITFFGESLPEKFFLHMPDFNNCDLLIVAGTSLQVQPFALLIDYVSSDTPRLLINREKVACYTPGMGFDFDGSFSSVRRDIFYGGSCDDGVLELAELLGWKDELQKLHKEGHEKLKKQQDEELPKEELEVNDVDTLAEEFVKKVGISEEKSVPNKVGVSEEKSIPGKVGVSEEKSIPEKVGISEEKSIPDKVAVSEEKSTPGKVGISEEKSTPDKVDETKENVNKEDTKVDKLEKGILENKSKEETKL
ncbi:33713_t:CDS:2 [Gigaspora margarita]|uniref:33713_t:CDS:1 n=1 Tax=Gigaspora margarita TaxID=4874 RepID=A0ABM8VW27_GIGMA|nr:33713_t:CDS:2 [Gigaspora margarita]